MDLKKFFLKAFLVAILVTLSVGNLVFGVKYFLVSRRMEETIRVQPELWNLEGRRLTLAGQWVPFCGVGDTTKPPSIENVVHPKLTLLIFVSPGDDPRALQEVKYWETLRKDFSARGFEVLGWIDADSSENITGLKSFSPFFASSMGVRKGMCKTFGVPITPFKMFVDADQAVVHISGPNLDTARQKKFYEVASKLCEVYLKPIEKNALISQTPAK